MKLRVSCFNRREKNAFKTKCILRLKSVQQLWDYCTDSFSMPVHNSMGMRMPSLLVSNNVFRVDASVRTFVELQNALQRKENDAKHC